MGHYPKQNNQEMFQTAQKPKTNPNRGVVPSDPQNRGDLAPINPIRTETVLSKLPIHTLSKKGSNQIRIIHRPADGGQIDLYWKVSPNQEYGAPRQLAYKLDKLVIDRKIDTLARPVPRIIHLGSLHQIAQELGLRRDTNSVKKALYQNASVFCTIKLSYTSREAKTRRIEQSNNRYRVILKGQDLPDGSIAENVYIAFNDPFLEIINNSPTRPLDYDYLKALPPAASRFYELVSFQFFAAFKYGHQEAKIRYSDYCQRAPQNRYFSRQPAQNQMNGSHRHHKRSGYIARLRYTKTTDEEGRPDWFIHYTPGPKAFAEYQAFTGKQPKSPRPKAITPTAPKISRGLNKAVEPTLDPKRLSDLTSRGVIKSEAVKFLSDAPQEFLEYIDDCLDYFDTQPRDRMDNPGALLAQLIRKKISFPETFITRAQRRQHEAERQAQLERNQQQSWLRLLYERYERDTIQRWIETNVPKAEFQDRLDKAKATFRHIHIGKPSKTLDAMASGSAQSYYAQRVPLMSFDDFSEDKTAQKKAQESLKDLESTQTPTPEPQPRTEPSSASSDAPDSNT